MRQSWETTLDGEADTQRLGAALAKALPSGGVVSLIGTLGAGKTRLVQGICESLGIDRSEVVSPTFVLLQEHHGDQSVYHFDAYRLANEEEFRQLGSEEYFTGGGLVLIEWGDRVSGALPDERLEIEIVVTGDEQRIVRARAFGQSYEAALAKLAEYWQTPIN